MFYIFMDFVIIILEAVCCQMFFDIFHQEEKPARSYWIRRSIAVAAMGGLSYVTAMLLNEMLLLKQVVVFLLIVGVMTFIRKIPWKKSSVLALLFQGMLAAVEYMAFVFVKMVIPDMENMTALEEALGRAVVIIDMFFCFVTIILIGRIFQGHKNKIMYSEEWLKYILFPLITLVLLSAILTAFKNEKDAGQLQVLCGVGLGLVVMNFLVFFLLEDVIRIEESVRERESFDIQGKNQLELYSKLNEYFEAQKSDAHEFKNHLTCIQSLAKEHNYEEMEKYLETVAGEAVSGGITIDTNNDIINTVINTKYKEAVKKHIVVVFRVNDLSGIRIEDKDMVVLLSNLLNNAIEAVEKCRTDKVIQVKFMQDHGNVVLSVKNRYAEPLIRVQDGFLTTKRHGKNNHGIGLKNTLKVIEKYNGIYNISTDNHEFFFSIVIPGCAVS